MLVDGRRKYEHKGISAGAGKKVQGGRQDLANNDPRAIVGERGVWSGMQLIVVNNVNMDKATRGCNTGGRGKW